MEDTDCEKDLKYVDLTHWHFRYVNFDKVEQ